MSSLVKFATIIAVIPGKFAQYEVRLDDHRRLIVRHSQIRPVPAKLLRSGARLAVYEVDGEVKWASTDLSSRHEKEEENPRESTPKPTLPKTATVTKTDPRTGLVVLRAEDGEEIKVRLPVSDGIWSTMFRGRQFLVELQQSAQGTKSLLTPLPDSDADGAKNKKDSKKPLRRETSEQKTSSQSEAHFAQKQREQKKEEQSSQSSYGPAHGGEEREEHRAQSSQSESFAAEQIGIDPAYFAEREKEGHRHEIMAFLREHLSDDLIEWYRMRDKQEPRYLPPNKPINPLIQQALTSMDGHFKQLYSHQARAINSIRSGRNLIVVTQTASGKTLCYNPAIFEHFLSNDSSAHALYIFPLNALLMDQKEKIDDLRRNLNSHGVSIHAELLKGGLGTERRRQIAQLNPQILAINPELLNWILQEPEYWQNFFSSLKYIVVDEVHTYRGILGLHMAGILRRLLLQARRLGSEPQFIMSSATVSNPMDLASRLTSLLESSFDILEEKDDGSAQAYKHWVVTNPDAHANGEAYDNYLTTAAMIMVELLTTRNAQGLHSPLNTIVFAKSIRDVNKIHKIVQENLRNHPQLRDKVRKYVSAELNSEEKREIYDGLKTGRLKGVVSTNALEAGIDIGRLDACIIAGFPFSVMRMRQMAGRVGRHNEGLVVFVPQSVSAVDQFYRLNQPLLLEQRPEVFVVDPSNPYIARKHINAAAYSLRGLSRQEIVIFGPRAMETAQQAVADGVMTNNGTHFYGSRRNFTDKSDPYAISSIRSQPQIPYVVCSAGAGQCLFSTICRENGDRKRCEFHVSTLDKQYAYRDCHPGAIYEGPDGYHYRINRLDDNEQLIYAVPMPENTLERTFVEEDVSIRMIGEAKATKAFPSGVELHVGEVQVTRVFTGYYTYQLVPVSTCRRCRQEYDASVVICPKCGRKTTRSYGQSKPKPQDFPEPHKEHGFSIILKTVACWLKLPAELEGKLYAASPCKLPGEQNRIAEFLKRPLAMDKMSRDLHLSKDERDLIGSYHEYAGISLRERKSNARETVLYPGVYGQCLLHTLRGKLSEGRALEIFRAATGYPVTDNLRHICRKCETSVLFQAMHTLEHTVLMRYPSVALGDISDLGSYSTVGHPSTGAPTVFWYDNYEGGLGAAEKIFECFQDLLVESERTLTSCTCNSLEGCPHCTHIGYCDYQNEALSKVGLLVLIAVLQGKQPGLRYEPFIYRSAQRVKFESSYRSNEYARQDHGIGEEAPQSSASEFALDPYKLLRVQSEVHDPVLEKAYEVRGKEITDEVPPVSAVELNHAYHKILGTRRVSAWNIQSGQEPYRILEILPTASLPMIQKIYRVIARQVHPDTYPGDKAKANEMMKLVNDAFEKVRKEKRNGFSDNGFDL